MNKTDLEFFKTNYCRKREHKLNVFLQNPLDNTFVEGEPYIRRLILIINCLKKNS